MSAKPCQICAQAFLHDQVAAVSEGRRNRRKRRSVKTRTQVRGQTKARPLFAFLAIALLSAVLVTPSAGATPSSLSIEDGFDSTTSPVLGLESSTPKALSDLDLPLGAKDIELLEQISPGDAEILDTSLSTNLDRERSGLRAKLQMQAYEIRPLLRQADQGYNTFRINGDSTGFIYETTDPAKANHLIAELGNVQIREVQVSEAHLESIVEAIQETLGEPGPLQPLDSLWVDKSINKVIVGVQPDKKILVEGILDRSNIASELIDVWECQPILAPVC